ncbi:hypothetical protein LTR37_008376 [Vermiconidia calcicola]|uniref:Uncharacterized protein n=1 Tax=Vermiconidia calcicola TaxID=1690605 RepID=A0ACC3NB03_9PEZI|nr:hypothetical protein LTR37_008376 [Vermiconidia calcicola]
MLQEYLNSSRSKSRSRKSLLNPARWLCGSGSNQDSESSDASLEKDVADVIRPFNFLDDDPEYRSSVAFMTFRFSAVLDVEKLRKALEEVFQLEGYHELGARIRLNDRGKLEHHIPFRYDDARPAFTWSHKLFPIKIEEHPEISKLPDGSKHTTPTMYTGVESWKDCLYPSKALPSKLQDYLTADISPITVHIASFEDATLLTLAFPHVVMDAVAASYLLKTWAAVTAGHREAIPPFMHDSNRDIVKEIIDSMSLVRFLGTLVADWTQYPKQDWRFICLPSEYVSRLKADAMDDCGGQYLSEGDVLGAWRNRLIAKACNWPLDKPILMLQYYSLHGVLDELPPGRAFIGNWVAKMFVMTTTREIIEGSIGEAALHIRNSLKQQRTREQAEAFLTMQSQRKIMMFGEHDQAFVGLSNIARAGLNKLDFSGAVVGEGSGLPVHLHSDFFVSSSLKLRNVGPIFGQDASGNWWMSWVMRSEAWPRVEQQLARESGVRIV